VREKHQPKKSRHDAHINPGTCVASLCLLLHRIEPTATLLQMS
jgi:hypothetical protein